MSSTPATTTTQQQSTKAPLAGPQRNLFNDVWGGATSATNNALATPIPQNTVAQATAPQYQGAQSMLNVAPSLSANAPATSNLTGQIASGYFENPQNNPNFEGAVNAALTPGFNQLEQQILPGITDASVRASGAGTGPAAYGSPTGQSPEDTMKEEALNNWDINAQNTGASMANSAYNAGLGLFSDIPGLATSSISQSLAPALAEEQAGSLLQGFNQSGLQNIINAYMMNTGMPLSFLSQGAQIGATGGFGNTNTTGSSTGPPPSMATQLLQGITGGAGATNSLLGSGPQGSPSALSNLASGVGNAASGAGSWLSALLAGAPAVAAAA
jgi:hypothetical protein